MSVLKYLHAIVRSTSREKEVEVVTVVVKEPFSIAIFIKLIEVEPL